RRETAEDTVEIRTPRSRWALDHAKPVGRENERRNKRSQLLRRPQRCPVQAGSLALSPPYRHLELEPHLATPACGRRTSALRAEAHNRRIGASAWRDPLGGEMDGLEQVRLAHAVRTHDEHESGLQHQLEPLVRAKVAERSGFDDQPGRRIGMTRYVKSSASSVRIAGRSGLISFIFTSSPSTDSSPSRRNSALKPISSGSPL